MTTQVPAWGEYGLLAGAPIPFPDAPMQLMVFGYQRPGQEETEDVVVLRPLPGPRTDGEVPIVRMHSACLTGDLFGSLKCDCGPQLRYALDRIRASGDGALLYLLRHEGRGIGLANKIRAYALQATGHDTISANKAIGMPVDARDFRGAATVLRELGLTSIRLMTNNPKKIEVLQKNGITVIERIPIGGFVTSQNSQYLADKDTRLGHLGAHGPVEIG
jgi:GTP cyclohydrolase II